MKGGNSRDSYFLLSNSLVLLPGSILAAGSEIVSALSVKPCLAL